MIRLRAVPKRNELMKGRTVDNSERNEIRVAHIKRNVHPSKSMCLFEKSCTEYKQSPKERDLYYYVSDLIGGHIDNRNFALCRQSVFHFFLCCLQYVFV